MRIQLIVDDVQVTLEPTAVLAQQLLQAADGWEQEGQSARNVACWLIDRVPALPLLANHDLFQE